MIIILLHKMTVCAVRNFPVTVSIMYLLADGITINQSLCVHVIATSNVQSELIGPEGAHSDHITISAAPVIRC